MNAAGALFCARQLSSITSYRNDPLANYAVLSGPRQYVAKAAGQTGPVPLSEKIKKVSMQPI